MPIGRWVLREGCRHARRVLAALDPAAQPTMSINLSLKQIQQSDIVADVRDALAESGLDPHCLTLEITETVLMADADLAVQRLQELKELGVRLALDDFGTGYSSLSYLSRFPVDILKMDRSFLRGGATPEASGLATAVVALGATLDLEVVAEGIEFPEQWHTLRDLGCEMGQGFYFARPMDADATPGVPGRRRRGAGRRCSIATRRSTARADTTAPGCSRRSAIATSGCSGAGCASRCSATARSSSRSPGRSTSCRTRPRRCRSSASR